MTNIAVILAGGVGKRFGGDTPKQLMPMADGRTVLEHSVDAFRACACINKVLVVADPLLSLSLGEDVLYARPGRERWESSWNAITILSPLLQQGMGDVNVLIHDAARPFVSRRIIEDVCRALGTYEAVSVAVSSTDTVYEVEDGLLKRIPNRKTMLRAQTPQAFRLSLIKRAYEIAVQDPNLQATDDCGIVHRYMPEVPICIVEGEETNRKITFREDLDPPTLLKGEE